ncbi:MAG: pirin-like C-terminal cupin domain-containing protein [Microthrixaceae bacterium]
MAHATLPPGSVLHVDAPSSQNALVYVLKGTGTVGGGDDPADIEQGRLAVFGPGDALTVSGPTLTSGAEDRPGPDPLEVIVLGGEPIGAPVVQYGPFVMNSKAEIARAVDDFNNGRIGTVPAGAIRPFRGLTPSGVRTPVARYGPDARLSASWR